MVIFLGVILIIFIMFLVAGILYIMDEYNRNKKK